MKITADSLPHAELTNFLGGEKTICTRTMKDELGKIMWATLEPGSSIGLHTHTTNSETIYIIRGKGKVLYEGAYETVETGDCHYCPKGHTHSLINDSDEPMEVFAVIPNQ